MRLKYKSSLKRLPQRKGKEDIRGGGEGTKRRGEYIIEAAEKEEKLDKEE